MCAADGQLISGDLTFDITDKVFRAGNNALMTAGGGSDTEKTSMDWMKTDGSWDALVDIARALHEDEKSGGDFVWTDGNDVKCVASGGCISRSPTWFFAIGCGREMAIGYLAASKQPETCQEAEDLARAALIVVSQWIAGVGAPFVFEWVPKNG